MRPAALLRPRRGSGSSTTPGTAPSRATARYGHWTQNNRPAPFQIASNFFPARGVYSSSDPVVLRAQMREIRSAGVDEVIVSWWGTGSVEDQRLPAVLKAARAERLTVALHIEPYSGRSPASVAADIARFRPLGITDFYVYEPLLSPAIDWAVANAGLSGVRIFAGTGLAGFAATGRFTGVYTYDIVRYRSSSFGRLCAQARVQHLLCAPSVGPGFDARRSTGATTLQPRRRGQTYDRMWRAALDAAPDMVTVTSYNEWHEGNADRARERRAALGGLRELRRRVGPARAGRRERVPLAHGDVERDLPLLASRARRRPRRSPRRGR